MTRKVADINYNRLLLRSIDTAETAFFCRQLEYVFRKFYEKKYKELKEKYRGKMEQNAKEKALTT